MEQNLEVTKFTTFENKLMKIRDKLILLDKDVVSLYDIEPKKLRQQIKRNIEKFPKYYAYQLSDEEVEIMGSQNATPPKKQFGGTNPYILEDDEDGEVIETTTKFEFNLGFAKVSRSVKKVKK